MKLHVKKGDTVVLLSGNEKGKSGKVIQVFPKRGFVMIEGVGMHKKHQKPRREGQTGQTVDKGNPVHISKVMEITKYKDRSKRIGHVSAQK